MSILPGDEPDTLGKSVTTVCARTFEDIVGQGAAVRTLTYEAKRNRPHPGIILHGAAGSGKRTVARIYARAVHCRTPTESGSACTECDFCRAFDEGRSFGYVELDGAERGSIDDFRYLVKQTESPPMLGRWRVVLINNAHRCEPEALDMILKLLEEPSSPTVFVLTTDHLKGMRSAVQSRCKIIRLKPIDAELAQEHLTALCQQRGIPFDNAALELMIAVAGGRTGQLIDTCCKVAEFGPITLDRSIETLGLTWGAQVVDYWRSALHDEATDLLEGAAALGVDAREVVSRMQAFFHALYHRGIRRPPGSRFAIEPAFTHVPLEAFEAIAAALREHSKARGVTVEAFWNELAKFWLGVDVSNLTGLDRELRALNRLLRPESTGEASTCGRVGR